MATRFLATEEAPIRREIKEHMASAAVDERSTTVVMSQLSNATRVFKNPIAIKINETLDDPDADFSKIAEFATGQRTKAMWQETGAFDAAMWSCGQSVGLIHDVPTCKVLVERIVAEAEQQLATGARCVSKL